MGRVSKIVTYPRCFCALESAKRAPKSAVAIVPSLSISIDIPTYVKQKASAAGANETRVPHVARTSRIWPRVRVIHVRFVPLPGHPLAYYVDCDGYFCEALRNPQCAAIVRIPETRYMVTFFGEKRSGYAGTRRKGHCE